MLKWGIYFKKQDNLQSFTAFVNAGADGEIRYKQVMTPLVWTALNKNPTMVRYLSKHFAYSELEKKQCNNFLGCIIRYMIRKLF